MPHPVRGAAAQRDSKLSRIRKLSAWIAGAAAAVSLGLGTAFAHELPGHARPATSSQGTGSASRSPAAGSASRSPSGRHDEHRHGLTAPRHGPSRAPAHSKPAASSGGS